MNPTDSQGEHFRLDPDAVRQTMRNFEDILHHLTTQTNIVERALQDAEVGDPHGYLQKGLAHGFTAVSKARTVEAMLAEIIRNTYATVNDFEQLDQQVSVTHHVSTVPAPATLVQPEAPMLLLGHESRAEAGLQAKPFTPTTVLPGGPAFDADGKLIRFNITVAEFEMLTADERIHWVLEMERTIDRGPWFHNIIDIITFFDESPTLRHMRPGSWVSWADAAVLEAIQNGYMLREGHVPVSMSGGAAEKWRDFFEYIINKEPSTSEEIAKAKSLWAIAEQHGVNYGLVEADREAGRPGGMEGELLRNFLGLGNTYRGMGRFHEGGGLVGKEITQRIGSWSGAVIDTTIDAHLYWIQFLPSPFGGPIVSHYFQHHDPFEPLGAHTALFVGENMAYDLGEAITDPRTRIPFSPRGPAYYFAKVIEQQTLKGGGTLPLPPGYTILPAGDIIFPTGTQLAPDGTFILRDKTHIFPDGSILDGNGDRVPTMDGVVLLDDGSLFLPNGYKTVQLF